MSIQTGENDKLAAPGVSYSGHSDAKVMMVDDESMTLRILQNFLEDVGYSRFVTTTKSSEAVALILEHRPDVLLLDIHMPEVDGFEILQKVRAHSDLEHLPVIILTASDDAAVKLNALELGATDFLAKPVDTSELALRLRNTLAAKAYQDRLAHYDALTDLPNRQMFLDRFSDCQSTARNSGQSGALLHIDLDRFNQINESMGHNAGDRLLRIVARRIMRSVRDADEVCRTQKSAAHASAARFGGDEFMVLLPFVDGRENTAIVAARIIKNIARPIPWEGGELVITSSVGMLEFPAQTQNLETQLRNVALATARAKQLGRNRCEFYSQLCETGAARHVSLEADLHQALTREELRLVYQPKLCVTTGEVKGAEALLRWEHTTRGMIGPDQFIPLAEESGLIVPIGSWVIETACQQLAQWRDAGWEHLHVAVNVASLQLRDGNLINVVREALAAHDLPPERLTVELTESAAIENAEANFETLVALRELGVRLSLDDFGTGYSSLSYLERLPIDELKIDRSFVSRIDAPGDEAPILRAVILMARSLGLKVVAEGVETDAQLNYIKRYECELFQGYLVAKPMQSSAFTQFMVSNQSRLQVSDLRRSS